MQTKHLCVLLHISTKGEVARREIGSSPPVEKILTIPRRCFFGGYFTLFLSCFSYAFARILLMPCGHLLGKG